MEENLLRICSFNGNFAIWGIQLYSPWTCVSDYLLLMLYKENYWLFVA